MFSIQFKLRYHNWILYTALHKLELCKVEADVVFGTVQESTTVIIGNIPHKADYRAWATENMYEMREDIKVISSKLETICIYCAFT